MGVRTLHDPGTDMAVLYCSTTDTAFGPVFRSPDTDWPEEVHGVILADACDVAQAFQVHLRDDLGIDDARRIEVPTLINEYNRWCAALNDHAGADEAVAR